MHDARLDDRLGPRRGDRLGEAGQPVAADDQDVLDAAVGQLGADPGPELRALGGLHPDAQDVLDPVQVDPDGEVRGPVADVRPVADLDHERVQVQHRVERLQRAGLPRGDLLGDGLGDLADGLVGQLRAERGREVVLDVADRHPARVQADDHVLEPAQAAGALGDQPRGERAVAVPRLVQPDVPDLGADPLRGGAVAGVATAPTARVTAFVVEMIGQFGIHPTLQDRLDQLGQEPACPVNAGPSASTRAISSSSSSSENSSLRSERAPGSSPETASTPWSYPQ